MYKVIYAFADLMDNDYVYAVGDTYPRKGLKVSKERIHELASRENKIGRPLIEEVEKPKKK